MTSTLQSGPRLFKKICRIAGTTLRDHAMIGEGDRVLVALSGGKDSMVLLRVLAERRRAMPFAFELEACHVEAGGIGYRIDRNGIESFCRELEVPLHWRTIEPDLQKNPRKSACFVCSWHRRKALFDLTREEGFTRLAFGHHRTDAVETLLMNMIYHGSISSLPYTLEMFDGRLTVIRPLLDLDEGILKEYASEEKLAAIGKSCPHEERNRREKIRTLLEQVEKVHGKGPYHIFRSMNRIISGYLPVQSTRKS